MSGGAAPAPCGEHPAGPDRGGRPRLLVEDRLNAAALDRELVREVVESLVSNAPQYAGAAGPVTVSVRFEGEQVRLDVRDVGPGIPEGEQAALFAPGLVVLLCTALDLAEVAARCEDIDGFLCKDRQSELAEVARALLGERRV